MPASSLCCTHLAGDVAGVKLLNVEPRREKLHMRQAVSLLFALDA